MTLQEEALMFLGHLQALYLQQRDISALLPHMAEDSSWIETGAQGFSRKAGEGGAALPPDQVGYSGRYTAAESRCDVTVLTDRVCVASGAFTARPDGPSFSDLNYRFTAVCAREPEGMKLLHLHLSTPNVEQELCARLIQLEALTGNTPGGIQQRRNDGALSLISISDSFLSLFGYTREEIRARFHDSFLEMIDCADRSGVIASIQEQLARGDSVELEYHVRRKDGAPLWILEKGKLVAHPDGGASFYCVMLDTTRQNAEREALRLSLERHQIILNQATDIIFEWDMGTDTLAFSSNWMKKFGYEPVRTLISWSIPRSTNVHPDDMPALVKLMRDAAAGVPYAETEFRIRDSLGVFSWCRIRATVQFDLQHRPIKTVGVILDVDADKKLKQRLVDQAQRDPMTNLYNKMAVRALVTEKMHQMSRGDKDQALLIIDVDNFKLVNDTYGHLCGDSLLSDVAGVLKTHFRSSDVVGRIGGDEFLVYLPEIAGRREAAAKTEAVLAALHELRPERGAPAITCSIGIALFPQGGVDYYALFRCADMALYHIKGHGKRSYAFYTPAECEGHIPCGLAESAVGVIDSACDCVEDTVGEALARYAFQMLYHAIDVKMAIEKLLEIVGRACDVSRMYIFESSEDGLHCSRTFEWCNHGVEAKIGALQNLSYAGDLGDYLQNFDETGIFYCRDIQGLNPVLHKFLASQGVCALLQCAMRDDGVFRGYVGFDECRENRSWNSEQIDSLTLTANVLSTFLIKLRLKERLARLAPDPGSPKI